MYRTTRAALSISLLALLVGCGAGSAASISPSESSQPRPIEAPAITLETEPHATPTRWQDADLLTFAFVVEIDGRSHVVLSTEGDPNWGRGPLRELAPSEGADVAVGRQVTRELLPRELSRELARKVDLYDAAGKQCTSTIGEPLLVAQYGFGIEGLGLPTWDDATWTEIEHSPAEIAEAVWTTQPVWVVAALEDGCTALWARDAELPAPELLHYSDAPNAVAGAYEQAFERSTLVPDMRSSYETENAGNPDAEPWSQRMGSESVEVASWLDGRDQVRFLELEYGFDDSSCGWGFDTEIRMFTQVEGREFVELGSDPDAVSIFDADLDGSYEMIYSGTHDMQTWSLELRSDTPALQTTLYIDADFTCPC